MSYKSSKLFNIEDRKRQTGIATTEVDVFQWKSVLLEELRKNADFAPYLETGATWGIAKSPNRGFLGDTAADKAKAVDAMLTKIASVAPRCLVRSINKRTTSLEDVWSLIKDWAGIQSTGSKHLDYFRVKKSWNENNDETRQEFFYRLKDSMEDTLVLSDDNISENGVKIKMDEDLTPCINSIIVMDWVEALGGPPLVEHIFRVYAKDLESNTLGSLQTRISKNFEALLVEMQEFEQAKISRVSTKQSFRTPNHHRSHAPFLAKQQAPKTKHRQGQTNRQCKLCKSSSHFISACPRLSDADRNAIANSRAVLTTYDDDQDENIDYTLSHQDDSELDNPDTGDQNDQD